MFEILSRNIEDTLKIGYELGKLLKKSDLVCLSGQLGAGKTALVRGIALSKRVENEVSSPTFTLVNEYSSCPPIFHFDTYRLSCEQDFFDIGGEEYLDNGICIIEWAENILSALPTSFLKITISKQASNDNYRKFTFEAFDKYYENIIKKLKRRF